MAEMQPGDGSKIQKDKHDSDPKDAVEEGKKPTYPGQLCGSKQDAERGAAPMVEKNGATLRQEGTRLFSVIPPTLNAHKSPNSNGSCSPFSIAPLVDFKPFPSVCPSLNGAAASVDGKSREFTPAKDDLIAAAQETDSSNRFLVLTDGSHRGDNVKDGKDDEETVSPRGTSVEGSGTSTPRKKKNGISALTYALQMEAAKKVCMAKGRSICYLRAANLAPSSSDGDYKTTSSCSAPCHLEQFQGSDGQKAEGRGGHGEEEIQREDMDKETGTKITVAGSSGHMDISKDVIGASGSELKNDTENGGNTSVQPLPETRPRPESLPWLPILVRGPDGCPVVKEINQESELCAEELFKPLRLEIHEEGRVRIIYYDIPDGSSDSTPETHNNMDEVEGPSVWRRCYLWCGRMLCCRDYEPL